MNVMRTGIKLICMTAAVVTGTVAYGITPDPSGNPFQNIVVANVFRLREPVPETKPILPKAPLPPIKLTGIMDWLGKTRALLEVILPASPPNPAKTSFLTLSPGETDGE